MRLKQLNQQGYNFIELAIAVVILSVMASAVITARSYMAKQTVRNTDKAYATQKAIQMFEELKALVGGNEVLGVAVLDNYSDGSLFNTILTTDKKVDVGPTATPTPNPADPLSGNRLSNGNWRYLRQVAVNRVANDPYVRQVVIKVWRYASDQYPNQPGELLSTVGGELRTITSLYPPTQTMDVYVISLNNHQAWWGILPSLTNTMQGVIGDIGGPLGQGRNPGLYIRQHFITRASYGRDAQYKPYINQASGTDVAAMPWVYFYPGLAPVDAGLSPAEQFFYDPSNGAIMQCGNFNTDTGLVPVQTSQFPTCPSYAVADQFNHGMRYYDEVALYNAAVAAAKAANLPIPEISYRMLIEGMNSSPASFTNSIIFNLHGEVEPLFPVHNYSDAAKDPGNVSLVGGPYKRIVTHPELLYYPASSPGAPATVNLRVYGYFDGLEDITTLDTNASTTDPKNLSTASVYLPNMALTALNGIAVSAIYGGSAQNYGVTNLAQGVTLPAALGSMSWSVTSPNGTDTLITLNKTPLRCPRAGGNGSGLNAADRLYGLEYIPCPPDNPGVPPNGNSFPFTNRDLTNTGAAGTPKNTARWIIQLQGVPTPAPTALPYYTIETHIGGGSTGNFPNLSRTYVWVGNAATNIPPITEQYQFLGDPRHCPYLDVKVGGPAGGAVVIQGQGYNWWFKNTNVDGYTYTNTNNGWRNGIDADVPRYNWVIRNALLKTTSIWCTLNGFSFYYHGLGGEFGFDHSPYSNGISFRSDTPWNTSATAIPCVGSEIAWWPNPAPAYNNERIIAGNANATLASQWVAKSWMGELYPDTMYSTWATIGNLPTADNGNPFPSALQFYRADCSALYTNAGSSLWGFRGASRAKVNQEPGCASFFDGGLGGGNNNFMHGYADGFTGISTSLAATCFGIFQFSLPSVVNLARPWTLNSTASQPPEWATAPYNTNRTSLTIPAYPFPGGTDPGNRTYYKTTFNGGAGSGWYGAGVVQMNDQPATKQAYVIETGTSPSANVGSVGLAKTMMVLSLRTFLDGGQIAAPGALGHITQLPVVKFYPVMMNGPSTVINPVPQFSAPQTIMLQVAGPLTDPTGTIPQSQVWFRYPGVTPPANYYTEEYPPVPNTTQPLLNSTYTENVNLIYNLKYSYDTGKTWRFMQDSSPAQFGVLDTVGSHPITDGGPVSILPYNWDVSNVTTYPQGNYWLMVEAYRQNIPLHYSYHILGITINR